MTDRITTEAHEIPWVGETVASLDPVPLGTWEVIEHGGCAGVGSLKALTPGDLAPLCPVCDREVSWRLSHLAPSVAADQRCRHVAVTPAGGLRTGIPTDRSERA